MDNPFGLLYTQSIMGQSAFRKIAIAFCALLLVWSFVLPDGKSSAAPEQPASTCNSYLLCDFETGEIIFANKPDERVYPASVTKMMTALILIEKKPDLSEKVTVGSEINNFGPDASKMGIKQNEVISYKDLLYGMLLVSGNDAAATVAVKIGGSISGFAELMNQRAGELGMTSTHFVNPHGMQSTEHYTTAADLAKLAIACMKNPTFAEVVKTAEYTTPPTNKTPAGYDLKTTNRLLSTDPKSESFHYDGAIGIKTGSTSAAQGCLVAAAKKNGRTLIAVMMGDDSSTSNDKYVKRWTDSVKFFNYGFGLVRIDLVPYIAKLSTVASLTGKSNAALYAAPPASLGYWTNQATAQAIAQPGAITVRVEYNNSFPVFAPTHSPIGTAVFSFGNQQIYRTNLTLVSSGVKMQSPETASQNKGGMIIVLALVLILCLSLLLFILTARKKAILRRRMANKAAAQRSNRPGSPLPPKRQPYPAQPQRQEYPPKRPSRNTPFSEHDISSPDSVPPLRFPQDRVRIQQRSRPGYDEYSDE